MSRQNLLIPLSMLIFGLAVIMLMLARPEITTGVAPQLQQYPVPDPAYPYDAPETITPQVIAPPEQGQQPTAPPAAPAQPGDDDDFQPGQAATPAPNRRPAATPTPRAAQTAPPAETPTPDNSVVCAPGVPVDITGTGPARAGFLLYFQDRPVSGGSVGPDGTFVVSLTVGDERPGTYAVRVEERGTRNVLRELTCVVPRAGQATPNSARP